MKVIIITVLMLILSACSSTEIITTPEGNINYIVKCPSDIVGSCYRQATKHCPMGYSVITSDRSATTKVQASAGPMFIHGNMVMHIECNETPK